MATATLPYELAAPVPVNCVTPWWRRKDPYVLTPVAVAHVIAHGPALHWIGNSGNWPYLRDAVTGVIVAQVFLLGVWAAFGGLRTLPRLGVVSLVFLGGLASYLVAARENRLDSLNSLLEGGLIGALCVSFFAALLLPLRRLVGWRIDFDVSRYQPQRGRRGQLGLLDFAGLSCAFALPLTAMRLMEEYAPSSSGGASEWLSMFAILAVVAASAAPASYAALAWRRAAAIVPACAVLVLLVAWAESLLSLWFPELDFTGGQITAWGIRFEALAFHAGVAATCVATFAVLRAFGLKLLVVPFAESQRNAPGEACLSPSARPTMTRAA